MKYERLTEKNNELGIVINKKVITLQGLLDMLFDLEDKIERGELISTKQEERSDQELAFFAEHNDGVRKLFADDLKDRLQADLAHGDITQEAYEVVVGEINYCLGEVEE